MFKGRTLLIATKHRKETVIAKHAEPQLGVTCVVPHDFDTDQLGTFTGEIERVLSPQEAAREKCLRAMERNGHDLAIANEGSFGPHPSLYFIPAAEEIMVLIDKKYGLEIVISKRSTRTNFAGKAIHHITELEAFAAQVQFPSHGLILRRDRNTREDIVKDILSYQRLYEQFHRLHQKYGTLFAETDMRAMHNPTRMAVIEEATLKLLDAIHSACPGCGTPGFIPVSYISGLPCGVCGMPTKSILASMSICKKCGYTEENQFPDQKTQEDPQFCDHCNP